MLTKDLLLVVWAVHWHDLEESQVERRGCEGVGGCNIRLVCYARAELPFAGSFKHAMLSMQPESATSGSRRLR